MTLSLIFRYMFRHNRKLTSDDIRLLPRNFAYFLFNMQYKALLRKKGKQKNISEDAHDSISQFIRYGRNKKKSLVMKGIQKLPHLAGSICETKLKAPSPQEYEQRRQEIIEKSGGQKTEADLNLFDGLKPEQTPRGPYDLVMKLAGTKKETKEYGKLEQELVSNLSPEDIVLRCKNTSNTRSIQLHLNWAKKKAESNKDKAKIARLDELIALAKARKLYPKKRANEETDSEDEA